MVQYQNFNQFILQQSLIPSQNQEKMMFDAYQHGPEAAQQKQIMMEIHSINTKLKANSNNKFNLSVKPLLPQQPPQFCFKFDERYFSSQCDELFQDQLNKNTFTIDEQEQQSLFGSKNDMLIDYQFEKQVKNFTEFQTNKFSSMKTNKEFFNDTHGSKQRQTYECSTNNRFQSSKVKQNFKKQKSATAKQSAQIESNHSITKGTKQHNPAERLYNKQNVPNYSNLQKPKSIIRQMKSKIKLTQQHPKRQNENDQDSLQKQNKVLWPKRSSRSSQNLIKNNNKNGHKQEQLKNILQCTFKPNILKKSHQIAQNLQPSFQRLTQDIGISRHQQKVPYKSKQQTLTKKYSVKRMEQLSKPRRLKTTNEPEEQQQFNFCPSLSKKSLQQMANCTINVAERNQIWLEQKQEKIHRLKTEYEQNKMKREMGTFVPKINAYKGQSEVHLSRFGKQGISNYFQRVSMAKSKNIVVQQKSTNSKSIERKSDLTHENTPKISIKLKKKTYDQAVRQLHQKIMNLNI